MDANDAAVRALIERVRAAHEDRTPLAIVGGGSKAFYGGPLMGAPLSTRALSGITAYEPSELVVTVRAGTPLADLQAALAERGQALAFDPPHHGPQATVGGMVAAGLSGPSRASAGSVRDHVLGATLINGRGELLTFGGQVMKNVAGYDVSRLLAGSLGVLGVIAEVSIKVLPVPPADATLCFEMPQAVALAQLARWRSQPLPIHASCWVHDDTASPPREVLYLRLRGAQAAVEAACTRLLAEHPGQRLDAAQVAADWVACREQTLPFFTAPSPAQGLWRLSVAPTTPVLALPGSPLVEWHGGLRWVWAGLEHTDALRRLAAQAGGHATLYRAPAQPAAALPHPMAPLAEPLGRIHRELKRAFDPAGILNRGRLQPDF